MRSRQQGLGTGLGFASEQAHGAAEPSGGGGVFLLVAEFPGQSQCDSCRVCPMAGGDVARVGSLKGTDEIGEATGPPRRLAQPFKILGSERSDEEGGDIRLESLSLRQKPVCGDKEEKGRNKGGS